MACLTSVITSNIVFRNRLLNQKNKHNLKMSYLLAGSGSLLGPCLSSLATRETLQRVVPCICSACSRLVASALLIDIFSYPYTSGFTQQHHQREANSFPFQRLPPFLVPCPAWPQAHCQGHLSAISLPPLIHSHPTASGIPSPTFERNTSRTFQPRSLTLVIGIH